MNKTYKYLAMAALALGVVACQQDDEFASLHSDVVRIASANIAAEVDTRVNTLENGNAFEFNDQILLVNENRTNKNKGFYTYKDPAWSTSDMVLYASGTNTFSSESSSKVTSAFLALIGLVKASVSALNIAL